MVNKVVEKNRIFIVQLVVQTQKGVLTSKRTGLANPAPCKQQKHAQRLLREKEKLYSLKSPQSENSPKTKARC